MVLRMQEAFAVIRSKSREAAVKSAEHNDQGYTPAGFRVSDNFFLFLNGRYFRETWVESSGKGSRVSTG